MNEQQERESMSEAVRAAGQEAAANAAQQAARKRASDLAANPALNMRMVAIELAQRAATGKQWTPEQYQEATEFYYGFLTAEHAAKSE